MAARDGDQIWNQLQSSNQFRLENAMNGVNSVTSNFIPLPHAYQLASSSTNTPSFGMPMSRLSYEAYNSIPATINSSHLTNHLQHGHFLNPSRMHYEETGSFGQRDRGKGPLKRKWPSNPPVIDARFAAGHFNRESSYFHIQRELVSDSQHTSWNLDNMVSSDGNELPCQGSSRNVRHRYDGATYSGDDLVRAHFPSAFVRTGDIPGPSNERAWNHYASYETSLRTHPFADPEAFSSETDMHFSGSSSRNFHINNTQHYNSHSYRNVPTPTLHVPTLIMGENSGIPDRRTASSWRAMPGPRMPYEVATSSRWNNHAVSRDNLRRPITAPNSGGEHVCGRTGTIRDSNRGFHSFEVMVDTHRRWRHQGYASMNGVLLYDDQHRDMRLDIDNMGYEELLALGERIGNVSTGITDDMLSKCMSRTTYSSSLDEVDDDDNTGNCVICLENYKVGEEVGTLKCGHGYHFCCIKKWLEIKNSCPICKVSALEK